MELGDAKNNEEEGSMEGELMAKARSEISKEPIESLLC